MYNIRTSNAFYSINYNHDHHTDLFDVQDNVVRGKWHVGTLVPNYFSYNNM